MPGCSEQHAAAAAYASPCIAASRPQARLMQQHWLALCAAASSYMAAMLKVHHVWKWFLMVYYTEVSG